MQAVLRALYAYFADRPLKEIPHIEVNITHMLIRDSKFSPFTDDLVGLGYPFYC